MCLLAKTGLDIFDQALSVYDGYDQNPLLPYFVHKAIAINKPFSDILISNFRQHPADKWKFPYLSRCLKYLGDNRLCIE